MPDFISDRVVVDGEEMDLKYGHPIVVFKTIAYGRSVLVLAVSTVDVAMGAERACWLECRTRDRKVVSSNPWQEPLENFLFQT